MISQAPNNPNPSGLQPVAATGAGVQFATDLNSGASWDEGYTGLGSGLTQNGTGTQRTGQVGGICFFLASLSTASHGEAVRGEARRHVTPRNGDNFPRRSIAWWGEAWRVCARQQRYPERNLGQFFGARLSSACQAQACLGESTTRAWRGIQAQFLISGQGVAGLDRAG